MEPDPQSSKTLKIKVGIFFGYNGESFNGMQYQRDTGNTVENIVHKLLLDNGFILRSNAECLKRIKWSRAGRTDKKVHALCNGISASLEFGDRYIIDRAKREIDFERVVNDINEQLPFEIRIFTIKKIGKSFDMRHDAHTRIYNYIAPLRLFLPIEEFKNCVEVADPAALVERLNQLAQKYLGTRSYNNFTKGYKPKDPRCDRYILAMKAEIVEQEAFHEYFMRQANRNEQEATKQAGNKNEEHGTNQSEKKLSSESDSASKHLQFVRFTLVGQSFIYHQIRKMIGLLVKIQSQQLDPEATFSAAFSADRYEPYLVPGEGLYLNRMTFEGYNRKKQKELRVELNEQDQLKIRKYRSYLQSRILEHEIKEGVFTKWMHNRDSFTRENEEEERSQSE